jgi:hypothetical protein
MFCEAIALLKFHASKSERSSDLLMTLFYSDRITLLACKMEELVISIATLRVSINCMVLVSSRYGGHLVESNNREP